MLIEVQSPDTAALQREADSRAGFAVQLEIDSHTMYEIAADELRAIKARIKQLNETRVSITRPIDEAKKRVMEMFTAPIERLTQAEITLKQAMIGWDAKVEARRLAEQREAEAQAAQERARLEAQAAALEAAAREAAATPAANPGTWIEAQHRAVDLEQQASDVRSEASMMIAPVALPTVARPKGVSSRETWEAEVTDLLALVRHCAEHPEYVSLLMVDSVALRALARAQKAQLALPGVRVAPKRTISARAS